MNEKRKQKLSDIDPSELSLVRRGAVRRPWLFLKSEDAEAEVEAEVARRLAEREPVAKDAEDPLSVSLRRAEERMTAETGLRCEVGESFAHFAERVEKAQAIEREAKTMGASPDGLRVARKVDARAAEIRKADTSLSAEQAAVRAYGELSPAEYQALQAYDEASEAELIAKAEAEQAEAFEAAQRLPVAVQKTVDEIRKSDGGGLSREQAVARALNENPQLYEHWLAVDGTEA